MASPSRESSKLRFGAFEVDPPSGRLLKTGIPLRLPPQPFKVLLLLLEQPGDVVTRERIRQHLWGDSTFVDFERGINFSINQIRAVLNDDPDKPRYVETLPKIGYRFVAAVTREGSSVSNTIPGPPTDVLEDPAQTNAEASPSQTPSPGTVPEKRAHRGRRAFWLAIGLIFLTAIAWRVSLLLESAPFQRIEITQVTGNGKVKAAAISPNGRYVGYVVDEGSANPFFELSGGGKESLWVRQVAGGNDVQMVPAAEVAYKGLTFSPDGDFVYAIRSEGKSPTSSLYKISVLGGTETRLITDLDDALTFSPDGKKMAFVRFLEAAHTGLFVANEDGSGERLLAECKSPPYYCVNGIAWSPNGRTIATNAFWGESSTGRMSPLEFSVQSGAKHALSDGRWAWVGNLGWVRDGRGLIVNAMDLTSTHQQIGFLSYPEGQLRRITTDTNEYHGISLTADSRILATVQQKFAFDCWVAPVANPAGAKPITSGGNSGETMWSPNGRVVFQKIMGQGEMNLWSMESDGSKEKQLTANAGRINVLPHVSPDGRYIVFVSERNGTAHLWRMDIDGSNPKQLTSSSEDYSWFGLDFTKDAKWVIFTRSGAFGGLWKVSIEGGEPVRLNTPSIAYYPAVSPDGKMLAYYYEDSSGLKGVEVMSLNENDPRKRFDLSKGNIRWMPDSRSLLYVKNEGGVSNLWSQPISGDHAKPLSHFNDLLIASFDISRDGKQLIMSRGTANRDVVLIRDLR